MHPIHDPTILSKTRAEEHDDDVWGKFFLPPYFNHVGLKTATKSTYIIGKRGCGKTMLLKFLDFHTAFSPSRQQIDAHELNHIGIYWRADTQFCNSLKRRLLDDDEWVSVFESYFALVVSLEIIRSIRAISCSAVTIFSELDFLNLKFESAKDFHPSFPVAAAELEQFLESTSRSFSTWISNMALMPRPILPPGKYFIDSLIGDIRKTSGLAQAAFYVYVDEIENLVPYQRRVLNSMLKHSQKPFIVSFTSKELSSETATTGPEFINATHDFHILNLDEMIGDQDRKQFFAEVYLANLDLAKGCNSELLNTLRDVNGLTIRRLASHQEIVMREIRSKFPSISAGDLAIQVLSNSSLLSILQDRITKALRSKSSNVRLDRFVASADCADAMVVLPALLSRKRLPVENVVREFERYKSSKEGSFATSWVQNNLVGALLELYRPYNPDCPIFSGFDTFCTMANNNLRHFLILGYKTFEIANLKDECTDVFSIETQARAANDAAEKLITEIATFGKFGARLKMFVLRLGQVFKALQSQPAMSEPEQNQFTINSGSRTISAEEIEFLSEAKKYAILIEQLETKSKNSQARDVVDYQLNPIYAPYFQISHRRKRKIEISVDDFHAISLGTEDNYNEFVAKLLKSNSVELPQLW
jgi:hypothetical protein